MTFMTDRLDRFSRQMAFPGIGEAGQKRLLAARVAVVGCGGLGSTLAACMGRAGIGGLTLIDGDVVDLTNLHRQFMFDEKDAEAGTNKAMAAAAKLRQADSGLEVEAVAVRLERGNADELLSGHDLILDGLDNMAARYILNDWCMRNEVPWIYGGVAGSSGMVMVVRPGLSACLECAFPGKGEEKAEAGEELSSLGVINPLPAHVAAIQCAEAQKLLVGSGEILSGLKFVDLWSGECRVISINRRPGCSCARLR